ncbi:uncharacterized protein BcabD6B2_15550 [Babesia caballi]|uniref:Uncharacterized protein n=1 Tax=Babesia caballi TaxID=5871 RepID=A0AAV4LQN4_BABCB|nr:hypothetical protein BcabD6B2_15550 [Babesia caballi]
MPIGQTEPPTCCGGPLHHLVRQSGLHLLGGRGDVDLAVGVDHGGAVEGHRVAGLVVLVAQRALRELDVVAVADRLKDEGPQGAEAERAAQRDRVEALQDRKKAAVDEVEREHLEDARCQEGHAAEPAPALAGALGVVGLEEEAAAGVEQQREGVEQARAEVDEPVGAVADLVLHPLGFEVVGGAEEGDQTKTPRNSTCKI